MKQKKYGHRFNRSDFLPVFGIAERICYVRSSILRRNLHKVAKGNTVSTVCKRASDWIGSNWIVFGLTFPISLI